MKIDSNMRLTWFEDFLALCESQSFSRAAMQQHVSQPTFSRRIQMLERWLGVDLVDRDAPHFRLTPTAIQFEPEICALVNRIHELQREMRLHGEARQRAVLTSQHMLTASHLPSLLQLLAPISNNTILRIRSGNRDECINQFVRGQARLLLCCESDDEPLSLDSTGVERMIVGRDRLIPVIAPHARSPLINRYSQGMALPENATIRLLSYPETSFFGKVIWRHCLQQLVESHDVETVCASAFSGGLKEMVLCGLGMAWLPEGLIRNELARQELLPMTDSLPSVELDISLFCSSSEDSAIIRQIWSLLGRERCENC